MKRLMIVATVALALTLTLIFSVCRYSVSEPDIVGTVKIVSDKNEYTPLDNWIYGLDKGVFSDGARLYPKDVSYKLLPIQIKDDFKIIIDGNSERNESYTLYNNKFEEISFSKEKFEEPPEAGEYILVLEISWGNEKRYHGYQYFCKLVK